MDKKELREVRRQKLDLMGKYFGKKNLFRKVWGFAMAAIFHKRYKKSF